MLTSRQFIVLFSIFISALLLYLAVQGVNWGIVISLFQNVQIKWIAAISVLIVASFSFRALRWRLLLTADRPIRLLIAFFGYAAGLFGNNVLPARAGELIRSYLVGNASGLGMSYVLATAFVERVMDAAILVSVSIISLATVASLPDWLFRASQILGGLALVCLLSIFLLPRYQNKLSSFFMRLPGTDALKGKIINILLRFTSGMQALRSPKSLLLFILLSAGIWSLDATSTILLGRAFNLTFTYAQALILLAGLGLSSAVPSTPGYIGVYQFVAVTILTPFGVSRDLSLAFILAFQAINYIWVLLLGGITVMFFGGWAKFKQVASAPQKSNEA